jgi:hypothetical protein
MEDKEFYERADEHIKLSNSHISKDIPLGKISASMMYGTARFNSWIHAYRFNNAAEMKAQKQEAIDYFVEEYRKMLIENLDDYIENFDSYMKP